MATDVMEPQAAEQVQGNEASNVTDVESKPKKRGRKLAEDDNREVFSVPADMLDEYGKIKTWRPDCGFRFGSDESDHKPLKKEKFATDEVFTDYRIAAKQYRIDLLQEEIEDLKKRRDLTANIENVVSREKAKKTMKHLAMVEKLKRELAEEGVDVESLLQEANLS